MTRETTQVAMRRKIAPIFSNKLWSAFFRWTNARSSSTTLNLAFSFEAWKIDCALDGAPRIKLTIQASMVSLLLQVIARLRFDFITIIIAHGAACDGDSGGPLFCLDLGDEGYKFQGIVNLGAGCGRRGLYTRVANYMNWIFENMHVDPK